MNEVLNIESDRLKKIVFKNVMDFQNKLKQNFDSGFGSGKNWDFAFGWNFDSKTKLKFCNFLKPKFGCFYL